MTRLDFGRGKLNGAALARMLRHKQKDVRTMFVALPRYRVHASYRYPWPLSSWSNISGIRLRLDQRLAAQSTSSRRVGALSGRLRVNRRLRYLNCCAETDDNATRVDDEFDQPFRCRR